MPFSQAMDTGKALEYLHAQAVCHGDLKPVSKFTRRSACFSCASCNQENVLVSKARRAMLCDFGLARVVDDQPTGLTTSKILLGTCRYGSPEVVLFSQKRTLEADIWSWGCLLFEVRQLNSTVRSRT